MLLVAWQLSCGVIVLVNNVVVRFDLSFVICQLVDLFLVNWNCQFFVQ